MVVDEDPNVAHTPPFFDEQGNVVHRCEFHFTDKLVGYVRVFADGSHWRSGNEFFGDGTASTFQVTLVREDCADCAPREVTGPFSFCNLRSIAACAFNACRAGTSTCAQEQESSLSKDLTIELVPKRGQSVVVHIGDERLGAARRAQGKWRGEGGLACANGSTDRPKTRHKTGSAARAALEAHLRSGEHGYSHLPRPYESTTHHLCCRSRVAW